MALVAVGVGTQLLVPLTLGFICIAATSAYLGGVAAHEGPDVEVAVDCKPVVGVPGDVVIVKTDPGPNQRQRDWFKSEHQKWAEADQPGKIKLIAQWTNDDLEPWQRHWVSWRCRELPGPARKRKRTDEETKGKAKIKVPDTSKDKSPDDEMAIDSFAPVVYTGFGRGPSPMLQWQQYMQQFPMGDLPRFVGKFPFQRPLAHGSHMPQFGNDLEISKSFPSVDLNRLASDLPSSALVVSQSLEKSPIPGTLCNVAALGLPVALGSQMVHHSPPMEFQGANLGTLEKQCLPPCPEISMVFWGKKFSTPRKGNTRGTIRHIGVAMSPKLP